MVDGLMCALRVWKMNFENPQMSMSFKSKSYPLQDGTIPVKVFDSSNYYPA